MAKSRKRILALLMVLFCVTGFCETWHLGDGNEWKQVSSDKESQYLLEVAKIKQMVNMGKGKEVGESLGRLKKNYPGIGGSDLESFIKGELLFSKGKFGKAGMAYEEFMKKYPESELYEAVLDRQFAVGTAFLAGEKKSILKFFKIRGYAEGVKIMERVSERAGDGPVGVKAALAVVNSYERREKFEDAYQKWFEISTRWPTGKVGRAALLGMGRCKHANYKGPDYDSSNLVSAKSYYTNFSLRYPGDAAKYEIAEKLELIEEQLAFKKLKTGDYYYGVGNRQSANFYYQMVIDGWGESTAGKKAKENMKR